MVFCQAGRRLHFLFLLCLSIITLMLDGCGRPLPYPTPAPAQQDLVVLTVNGPLTHSLDESRQAGGLEHDLAEAFAQELGVGVRFVVLPAEEIGPALRAGKGHLAAGWLARPAPEAALQASPPITQTSDVIVQHEASLPLHSVRELSGKTVHVQRGSRQAERLRKLRETQPGLVLSEIDEADIYRLIDDVESRRIDYLAVDATLAEIATQFAPSLQMTLPLGGEQDIVWWFPGQPDGELLAQAGRFLAGAQRDGTLARIEDRYLGHVRRLKAPDILKFVSRMKTHLPKLRQHFHTAQGLTRIDWRLLAALAYQESQWEADATSPTGVRGIMMLTEETADRMGVSNRLDARESIIAGARYINLLKAQHVEGIAEPDRTWLALAAYNIGPGHFNAARQLARQQKADPDVWYEMKRILPLLAQPKYYQRLKSGRARGGEAVILVENIRSYYDILSRYEAPHALASEARESPRSKRLGKADIRPGTTLGQGQKGRVIGLRPGSGPGLQAPR